MTDSLSNTIEVLFEFTERLERSGSVRFKFPFSASKVLSTLQLHDVELRLWSCFLFERSYLCVFAWYAIAACIIIALFASWEAFYYFWAFNIPSAYVAAETLSGSPFDVRVAITHLEFVTVVTGPTCIFLIFLCLILFSQG